MTQIKQIDTDFKFVIETKNASKLMNAFLHNFILVPSLGARGLIISNWQKDILCSYERCFPKKFL